VRPDIPADGPKERGVDGPERTAPSGVSKLRVAALACWISSVVLAAVGFRFLFAGNWLESHTVRYGPLALLALALVTAIAAIVIAVVGAARRPRDRASWVVAAIVVLPVPLTLVLSRMLGL
jgi:hypothetical protein